MRLLIIILVFSLFSLAVPLGLSATHPITIGKQCTDCHKPHGAVNRPLLK